MFMMRVAVWIEELGHHRPDILVACEQAYAQGKSDSDFFRVDQAAFLACPSDPIDYAVMGANRARGSRAHGCGLVGCRGLVNAVGHLYPKTSTATSCRATCALRTQGSLLIAQHPARGRGRGQPGGGRDAGRGVGHAPRPQAQHVRGSSTVSRPRNAPNTSSSPGLPSLGMLSRVWMPRALPGETADDQTGRALRFSPSPAGGALGGGQGQARVTRGDEVGPS